MTTITLLTALLLAGVSGVFSIFGMMAVFSGMPIVGLVAGAAIELGKLVGVSWLYRYWHDKVWFRHILATFTVVAMLVTSLGVFGMLSKAHTSQTKDVMNSEAEVLVIEQKIDRESAKIKQATTALEQLDGQINVLIQHSRISTKGGASELRKQQEEERKHLEDIILQSQEKIDALQEEKFEVTQALRDFKVEIGPLTQLTTLFFNSDIHVALNILILMIMAALDPMAIMLLMGYNHIKMKENKQPPSTNPVAPPATPPDTFVDSLPEVVVQDTNIEDIGEQPYINNEMPIDIALPDVIAEKPEATQPTQPSFQPRPKKKRNNGWFFDSGG